MAVARVTEIIAGSKKSFEDAVEQGIARASKTLKNIEGAWVQDIKCVVKNGKIADALIALFDELSAARVELPPGEQALAERLSAGYGTGIAEPLSFEARLVHALWLADRDGAPSLPAARCLALGELAQSAQAPLFVVCDGEPPPDQRVFFLSLIHI